MRVLIVEDRDDDRALLRRMIGLLRQGCEVVEAGTLAGALASVRARSPDLVLLDWMMPDASGLDAVAALRDLGVEAPVVVVTARADDRSILEAFAGGVANYLTKPLSLDVVRLRLGRYLAGEGKPCE
ncbi:MAG: response regulator [Planctomycetes bacterium]|nr:response regulator [Planctomycetota bacterium]